MAAKRYVVTFTRPDPMAVPQTYVVRVEAPDEEIALERALEDALYHFPSFYIYTCEEIAEDDE